MSADHLLVNDAFEASRFGVAFDVAWAQSLFTHLQAPDIRRCLEQTARCVRPGGRFFATFFECGDDVESRSRTSPAASPRATTRTRTTTASATWRRCARTCRGARAYVGDWAHPRAQRMARFDRE